MLVSIIGNNASGKTSLALALGQQPGMDVYLESHDDRPYQGLFSQEPQRYALPNQIDFMLRRAEQERSIRAAGGIGVQDGGLEQDFRLYTRLFHAKGFLNEQEFALCRRLYDTLRAGLPAPEIYIYLSAPLEILRERLLGRGRVIDLNTIVTLDDLPVLQGFLDEWVNELAALIVPVEEIELESQEYMAGLAEGIRAIVEA
jgi:deoxyadenosine/deoxycytidine kinase